MLHELNTEFAMLLGVPQFTERDKRYGDRAAGEYGKCPGSPEQFTPLARGKIVDYSTQQVASKKKQDGHNLNRKKVVQFPQAFQDMHVPTTCNGRYQQVSGSGRHMYTSCEL